MLERVELRYPLPSSVTGPVERCALRRFASICFCVAMLLTPTRADGKSRVRLFWRPASLIAL